MMLFGRFKTMTLVLAIAALVGGAGLFYRTQAAEPAGAAQATVWQADTDDPLANDNAEPVPPQPSATSLLSSRPMPRQALVGLDKRTGQLVVTTLDIVHEPTAVWFQGKTFTSYVRTQMVRTKHYDMSMVKGYDVGGKTISKKRLPELLQKETVALISTDPGAADPLNLRLFKEGTLLFVLPAPPPVEPPAPSYSLPVQPVVPGGPAPTYYPPAQPIVPGAATTPAPPAIIPLPAAPGPSTDPTGVETIPQPLGELIPYVVRMRTVRIPVAIAPERRAAIKEVRLLASADEGEAWECFASISPDESSVVFRAPRDGLYWLAIQTVGADGKLEPKQSSLRPDMKLRVDTNFRAVPVPTAEPSINPAHGDQEAAGQSLREQVPFHVHMLSAKVPLEARNMRVPVEIDRERRAAIKEVRLFASTDKGETWNCVATIPPDNDSFNLNVPKDGLYWLAVQTVGTDGKLEPRQSCLRPQMKVAVETKHNDRR